MLAGKELGLAIAIVSNRDDPDGLGRVKVKFPTLADRESDWSPVATPFGGAKPDVHGIFFVPEVGDTVVVGHDQADSKSVIVLGSLYSQSQKPPCDKDVRILQTTKKHFIRIVETPGQITIETADGQRVDIDDDAKTITIQANDTVTVKGSKKVNVTASETVDISASQSVSIKGTTSVAIDGGPSVTVKGTSVTVDAQTILLGAGATDPAVLGREFATLFAAHVHNATSLGAPTTPPLNAAAVATVFSKSTLIAK